MDQWEYKKKKNGYDPKGKDWGLYENEIILSYVQIISDTMWLKMNTVIKWVVKVQLPQ